MPLKSWSDMMKDADSNSTGFEPLQPGSYDFVVENPAEVGETSKGFPKFTINPSVESGDRKNARIFHVFNVNENPTAMKRYFFGALAALGLGPSFFETNPSNEQVAKALQGRRFSAEVFLEEGTDGIKRPRLRNLAPASGVAPVGPSAGVPGAPAGPAPQAATQAPAAAAPQGAPAADNPWATQAQAAPQAAPAADNPWATQPPPPPAFGNN